MQSDDLGAQIESGISQSIDSVRAEAVFDSVEWLVESGLDPERPHPCLCAETRAEAERKARWWATLRTCGFGEQHGLSETAAREHLRQTRERCDAVGVQVGRAAEDSLQIMRPTSVVVLYLRQDADRWSLLYSFLHAERVLHFSPELSENGFENSPSASTTLAEVARAVVRE